MALNKLPFLPINIWSSNWPPMDTIPVPTPPGFGNTTLAKQNYVYASTILVLNTSLSKMRIIF
jgi:hypothetical protein